MAFRAILVGLIGAAVLMGVATSADAQSSTTRSRLPFVSLAEADAAQRAAPATPRRGLRWNENGRWGLDFNLNQPVGRERAWGDVEAGAYYRLSPRLSVGATAELGAREQDPAEVPEPRRTPPRLRLESIFKF